MNMYVTRRQQLKIRVKGYLNAIIVYERTTHLKNEKQIVALSSGKGKIL